MTCLTPAPTTPETWFAAIERCAVLAGGPQWQSLALTGLAAVVVAAFAALLGLAVVGRVGR